MNKDKNLSWDTIEKNLYGMIAQEIFDILNILRYNVANYNTSNLGWTLTVMAYNDVPVVVYMGIGIHREVEFSAKWPDRSGKTYYLLDGGFINVCVIKEAAELLKALWLRVTEFKPEPDMMRNWNDEIKTAIVGIRNLRDIKKKIMIDVDDSEQTGMAVDMAVIKKGIPEDDKPTG